MIILDSSVRSCRTKIKFYTSPPSTIQTLHNTSSRTLSSPCGQGCRLTGARLPEAPKLCMQATKFLYKEPARAPINLTLHVSWDNGPYFPINLILLAELQTMEPFMYLM